MVYGGGPIRTYSYSPIPDTPFEGRARYRVVPDSDLHGDRVIIVEAVTLTRYMNHVLTRIGDPAVLGQALGGRV